MVIDGFTAPHNARQQPTAPPPDSEISIMWLIWLPWQHYLLPLVMSNTQSITDPLYDTSPLASIKSGGSEISMFA